MRRVPPQATPSASRSTARDGDAGGRFDDADPEHAAAAFTPVTGSGGTTPLSYSISPSLPTGLSFSTATGAITGTPTVTSSATSYTVTVTDATSATASNTFSLTVNGAVTATQAIASAALTQNHAATSFTPVTGGGGTTPLATASHPACRRG